MNEEVDLMEVLRQEGNEDNWEYQKDSRYKCQIVRNDSGAWCGYVAVPKGHPCFGLNYDTIEDSYPDLKIHGGLSYSEGLFSWKQLDGDRSELNEMIEKRKQETDYWTIGFDCYHFGDLGPITEIKYGHVMPVRMKNGLIEDRISTLVYRTKAWVWNETNELAKQLLDIEQGKTPSRIVESVE